MSCWAVVPLKARRFGKTRLSGMLDEAARAGLVQTMFDTVLSALSNADEIERIAIVSSEPERVPSGVLALPDAGHGLNPALSAAAEMLRHHGARSLLVIHADLPLVQASDIDRFVRAGRRQGMALAADRHGTGTNALFLADGLDFAFRFGTNSLSRHLAEARLRRITPALPALNGLAIDIDTPADLACLWPAATAPITPSRWSPTPCTTSL